MNTTLFQKNTDFSFDRYGDGLVLNLADYGIELIEQDGQYLVPMQTLVDFTMGVSSGLGAFFNGQRIFISMGNDLKESGYYDAPTGARSAALCKYGYGELCMMLDHLYGLKETHDIDRFDNLFDQIGFDESLMDTNPANPDLAIYHLINYYLDDIHSEFTAWSYLTGDSDFRLPVGPSERAWDEQVWKYVEAREAAFPEGVPFYQEVGNTAYITFDSFDLAANDSDDYYQDDMPVDTFWMIIKAHERIAREDSPIENVVIDLSNNTGGAMVAAVYVISWFLGEGSMSIKDTLTGAMSTTTYRCDVNLDREYDARDTVQDKNLFCLISPVSFSCGNLVPSAFKASNRVTLLGRTSGGGSCSVMRASSAWGTAFSLSGPYRMSFVKNGSFYDIDRGAEPDFTLTSPGKYYDREALTAYINALY
ncbi:MAG: hypothetical protein IJH86_09865 [Clostridia bacterium]|nr:hypothetical protein [Clostridia bacterium]